MTKKGIDFPPSNSDFDPHSVASMITVEEQKSNAAMRKPGDEGIVSRELVQDKDVIISEVSVPQYAAGSKMQADMDKMARKAEKERAAAEKKEKAAAERAEMVAEREALREEFDALFPSPQEVPQEVQDEFLELNAKHLKSLETGRLPSERKALAALKSFIAKQHKFAEARKTKEPKSSDLDIDLSGAEVKADLDLDLSGTESKKELDLDLSEPKIPLARDLDLDLSEPATPPTPVATPEPVKNAEPKVETPIVLGPEDVPDHMKETPKEGTRKEWFDTLRDLVSGAKEKLGMSSSGEKMKDYLKSRSVELDAALAKKIEGGFRLLGEKYNKLGWKSKLAVGISLGVGAGVSAAAVSLPGIIAFTLGITAQRSAGLASAFLKFEKSSQGNKEKAMWQAMGQTALMTGAMMLLTEAVKEGVEYADRNQWLGNLLGHHTETTEASAPRQEVTGKIIPAEPEVPAQQPPVSLQEAAAPTAAAGEVVAPSPEISAISAIDVKATPGHGYEFMMKRMWEQLQEKNIELPSSAPRDSDLALLLAADKDTIDDVIHQIAADPKHQFFRADGSSVRIGLDAHMTIGSRGELFLSDAGHEYQVAPPQAPVTAEVPAAFAPHAVETAQPEVLSEAAQAAPEKEIHVETPTPPVEQPVPESQPLPVETIAPQESLKPIDLTQEQDLAAQRLVEGAAHVAEQPHSIVNSFGVEVQMTEPHVYTDSAGHEFVYGGSPVERAKLIMEYLTKNPDKTIFAADDSGDYRIPWHLVDGKAVPESPVQTSGLLGFFMSFMKAPSPDEFQKIIK